MKVKCIKNRDGFERENTREGNVYYVDRSSIFLDADGDPYGEVYADSAMQEPLGIKLLSRFRTLSSSGDEQFNEQKNVILKGLETLAELSPSKGLYIDDVDCSGGVYSLTDIVLDDNGHVRLVASMWSPTELAKKTGYFED